MSKETTMSFRVEPDLRSEFHHAVESDHIPAAQVLRAFMRDYVKQHEARRSIDPAERKRREDAVAYSRASVSLEGFKVSPADERHAVRFINGEIDLPQFVSGPTSGSDHER
ncbi:antitoxin VbhA family protein [Pseudomonas syringae]|uniref:antitoxin VbhA family protein n=1 Tax=Pseudomonas syringae TaxID=317 RepID=UPI002E26F563